MRCFQARRRLSEISSATADAELLRHLEACPACARLADAERLLAKAFSKASDVDKLALPTLEYLRQGVDSRLRLAQQTAIKGSRLMDTIKQEVKRRSRLGIGVSIALATILFLTHMPFAFERTIGYEVAFAGVDERLALNDDGLTEFLHKLGVKGAKFDVSDCDKVCNVKVTNLHSLDDARLVQAAFKKLDNVQVLENVSEVRGEAKESAVKAVIYELGLVGDGSCRSEYDLQCLVTDLYADSGLCDIVLFNSKARGTITTDADGKQRMVIDCLVDSITTSCCPAGTLQCVVGAGCLAEGVDSLPEAMWKMLNGSGSNHVKILGNIDNETLKSLKEKGISVERTEGPDGSPIFTLTLARNMDAEGSESVRESDAGEQVSKSSTANLPEGYSLSQNYPNPFNPTTTIEYTVGVTGPVTLDIINVKGQVVRHLVDRVMSAGIHSVQWDSTNERGERVSSGVYFYRLVAGDYSETKSMTLLK
jgi:hypothetical protein